ncbi:MAG: orotate phosphoribosyltransferase [Armatimonadota bacterium]
MSPSVQLGIELGGAVLILLAFWANAGGRWSRESTAYLVVNLAGALLLGYIAVVTQRWGFVLLEVAWVGISLVSLLQHGQRNDLSPPLKEHTMPEDRARLLELLKTVALSRGHFILSSGKESTYYLDGRLVTLSAEGAYLIGKIMFRHLRDTDVQAVGGMSVGADPISTAVSLVSYLGGHPIPAFLVRKEAKTHGKQKQVEGPIPPNARVAIVEDTVTTGESSLKAIEAVEAIGCKVVTVLALVDRLEGGRELLESKGYHFNPLFTVRDLGVEAE